MRRQPAIRPAPRQTSFPTTPSSSASSAFQYSTARPPTNYSANSWIVQETQPPLPRPAPGLVSEAPARPARSPLRASQPHRHTLTNANGVSTSPGLDVIESDDDGDEDSDEGPLGATPIYARSDYAKSAYTVSNQAKDRLSRYSMQSFDESVYPRTAVTGRTSPGRETPLYAQSAFADQYHHAPTAGRAGLPASPDSPGLNARLPPKSGLVDDRVPGRKDGDEDEEDRWREAPTAWSRSSYTGVGRETARATMLETVYEGGSSASASPPSRDLKPGASEARHRGNNDGGSERRSILSSQTRSRGGQHLSSADGYADIDGVRESRSTMPSILDLGHLTSVQPLKPRQISQAAADRPSADHTDMQTESDTKPKPKSLRSKKGIKARAVSMLHSGTTPRSHPPELLFSPGAHQRLGRMSVAPARYTLPPTPRFRAKLEQGSPLTPATGAVGEAWPSPGPGHSGGTNPYASPGGLRFLPDPSKSDFRSAPHREGGWLSRIKSTSFGKAYLTYRPFFSPILTTVAAMLLTLTMQNIGGPLEGFVSVQNGGFGSMVGEGRDVSLGAAGWCQTGVDTPLCRRYRQGDFVSAITPYKIPGPDSLNSTLDLSLTALTCLMWFLAIFQLTIAFLHFFLLFGLSIPYGHFLTSSPLPPLTGGAPARITAGEEGREAVLSEKEVIQKEVDLRVRCERPPYESYGWVWWAWWAHKRGPVGHLMALAVGSLAICTLGLAVAFYQQVNDAVSDGKVSLGAATFVPLFVLILIADGLFSSVTYLVHARRNLSTFNNPPDPTPAAVLLPPNLRPMRHVRQTGVSSFFVAPPSASRSAPDQGIRTETLFAADPFASPVPALPGAPAPAPGGRASAPYLDAETVRWLAAYPKDTVLLPLITSLRAGVVDDNFVLSEVGLLYLRPPPDSNVAEEEGGEALLVPPSGEIREELLSDAHMALESAGVGGGAGAQHLVADRMLRDLQETFWWPSIEEDCARTVAHCGECRRGSTGLDDDLQTHGKSARRSLLPYDFQ